MEIGGPTAFQDVLEIGKENDPDRWKWVLGGGLRPFPRDTDHSKLFQLGPSVQQPVNKEDKNDC